MAFSRYITSGTASASGGFTHSVSNPSNGSYGWLLGDHMKIYLSTAGQSLASFTTALDAGTVSLFNPGDGYTLQGTTLTFSGLVASSIYQFQVKRMTPKLTHFVNFNAGSPLSEADLDNSNKYALFRAQELEDDMEENNLSLQNMKNTAGNLTGDFVDTNSVQTLTNKTFSDTNSASTFDGGSYIL
jgi:hypothetical protein